MKHRFPLILAILAAACTTLVASAGGAGNGRLFTFAGSLLATPGAGATSISVSVQTGNQPALHALIGASQNEVFTIGAGTEFLVWSHGVPRVGTVADLQSGDYVSFNIRVPRGSTLQAIENQPAAVVRDRQSVSPGTGPLWVFSGTVSGPQSGGTIALHVTSGNWKALHAMLGQSFDQTFTYNIGTIFLLWQGKVPTVIDPSQLVAGDNVTVRVRAPRAASLSQVESTPANRVGDHEPPPTPED